MSEEKWPTTDTSEIAHYDKMPTPAAADGLEAHMPIPVPLEERSKEDLLVLLRASYEDSEYFRTELAAIRARELALRQAAEKFAARVEERNPEWFRETGTDFAEADHALRAILGKYGAAPEQGGEKR